MSQESVKPEGFDEKSYAMGWWNAMSACREYGIPTKPNEQAINPSNPKYRYSGPHSVIGDKECENIKSADSKKESGDEVMLTKIIRDWMHTKREVEYASLSRRIINEGFSTKPSPIAKELAKAVEYLIDNFEYYEDEGPIGEGWSSTKHNSAIEKAKQALAKYKDSQKEK